MNWLRLVLGGLWTLPNTALGLLASVLGNAKLARVDGGTFIFVAQPSGLWSWFFTASGMAATTLGSTVTFASVVGASSPWLLRHELRHVWQYRVLGPLFLPLYLGIAAVLWVARLRPHWDHPFEADARRAERGG